jgi:acyl-CoA synthetase (AMP-forming)/AMP-acid ligase II
MHRDGVGECAVTDVKDARWGARLLAVIARNPKTEQPLRADDIKAHVMTFADKGRFRSSRRRG